MYEQVYEICRNTEEMLGMYSEFLAELDRNTVDYMIDELREEANRLKEEIAQYKDKVTQYKGEAEQYKDGAEQYKGEAEQYKEEIEFQRFESGVLSSWTNSKTLHQSTCIRWSSFTAFRMTPRMP